jgi:AcrR family transcriptional regulator
MEAISVPTGVHIRDPREQLFAAAERVLLRSGAAELTSRAVTEEAGVAKGVLHRHFADFDTFLADLVGERTAQVAQRLAPLTRSAGTGTVAGNLVTAVTELFDPVVTELTALVVFYPDLRRRVPNPGPPWGFPVLGRAGAMIARYLADECEMGRIAVDADVDSLALAVIGAGHLLYADNRDTPPGRADVERVVAAIVADVVQRRLL